MAPIVITSRFPVFFRTHPAPAEGQDDEATAPCCLKAESHMSGLQRHKRPRKPGKEAALQARMLVLDPAGRVMRGDWAVDEEQGKGFRLRAACGALSSKGSLKRHGRQRRGVHHRLEAIVVVF